MSSTLVGTRHTCLLIVTLAAGVTLCTASLASGQSLPAGQRKQMTAVRINGPSPVIDGRLNDAAWSDAVFVSDFLQKEPNEGVVPEFRTEVTILYSDDAVYAGARMYCDDPSSIITELNRRDRVGNAEVIILSLDTYLDRRTSYDFAVTAGGVLMDRYHPEDQEHYTDMSFNAVWDGAAVVDSLGWTAEIRIPFSQLRFNRTEEQVWGINWNRWIPARNEDIFWIYTPREETGWASRFGDLIGIRGVRPSRRLELLPYLAGDSRFRPEAESPGNPFYKESSLGYQGGADLKMGLGPNLTLDATVNPDFGQVEADPAEVNLTAFETVFDERRPFFIEGSQLFEVNGPNYFYSRRIGGPPRGRARGDFTDVPRQTTIPGAAKLSGRLPSGLSIGTLFAVTGPENAEVADTGSGVHSRSRVEPLTGYSVVRLQQEIGKDASTAGIILTGLRRDLSGHPTLRETLRESAFTGGADWNIRFAGGAYEVKGFAGFSHLRGDSLPLILAQRSSTHYFQRPDADHVRLDSTRRALSGYAASLQIDRNSGRHWLWGLGGAAESPGFDLNDAGVLNTADDVDSWARIVYRETTPGKILHRYSLGLYGNSGWNYGGDHQYGNLELNVNATLRSYWFAYVFINRRMAAQSDNMTRGGPSMRTPAGGTVGGGAGNNFTARTRYEGYANYSWNDRGGWAAWFGGELTTRLGRRLELAVETGYERNRVARQYVTAIADGPPETYDVRYIFAGLDRSEIVTQLRMNFFFSPNLSLEVYGEPFASSGRYLEFGQLKRARDDELLVFGEEGTEITHTDGVYEVTGDGDPFSFPARDFNFLSFRSNVVLRWEFRPGSTLYLVWQQDRSRDDHRFQHARPKSIIDSIRASGENLVAVKVSYWIPVP